MELRLDPAPLVLMTCALVLLTAMGCADDDSGSGGGGEYEAVCRSCEGDTPLGPNASREACGAFGVLFGCQSIEFEGSCANPDFADKAVCEVEDCASQPDCSVDLD